MKKLLVIVFFAASLAGCHKSITQTSVPDQVLTTFNQKYPFAGEVKWDETEGLYEAEFTDGDTNKEATFRADGTLLEVNERM